MYTYNQIFNNLLKKVSNNYTQFSELLAHKLPKFLYLLQN